MQWNVEQPNLKRHESKIFFQMPRPPADKGWICCAWWWMALALIIIRIQYNTLSTFRQMREATEKVPLVHLCHRRYSRRVCGRGAMILVWIYPYNLLNLMSAQVFRPYYSSVISHGARRKTWKIGEGRRVGTAIHLLLRRFFHLLWLAHRMWCAGTLLDVVAPSLHGTQCCLLLLIWDLIQKVMCSVARPRRLQDSQSLKLKGQKTDRSIHNNYLFSSFLCWFLSTIDNYINLSPPPRAWSPPTSKNKSNCRRFENDSVTWQHCFMANNHLPFVPIQHLLHNVIW